MMEYKRLTKLSDLGTLHALDFNGEEQPLCELTALDIDVLIGRLYELENKIESGELCDRKETAREILRMIKDKGLFRYGGYLLHDSDFDTISKLYGVEAKYERL